MKSFGRVAFSTAATQPLRAPRRLRLSGAVRLRLTMYGAFVALALAVLALAASTLRLESARAADTEILDEAGLQRTSSQQIGRLAALIAMHAADPGQRETHAQALDLVLTQSTAQALLLDAAMAAQFRQIDSPAPAVATTLDAWQAARERLWYRSQNLLRVADDGDEETVRRAAQTVQVEAAPALAAALQFSASLRAAAEQRSAVLARGLRWGAGGLLALLLLLGLGVVEPTARAVRSHGRRLREQADALQRLALVAEHTSALVLISDANDLVVWVNAAFEQTTGWSLGEAVGHRPGQLLASAQADEDVLRAMHEALRAGLGARHEWLHRTRDGQELWLDVDLRPLHDEAGVLSGFVRVCSDVSARVRQQGKVQAVFAALPTGVVVQSATSGVVEANPTAERLLGLNLAQMQGLLSPDPRWRVVRADGSAYPREEQPSMRTLASGCALRNETLGVCTSDGPPRWLLVNTEPQRDAQGHVTGVVACFSDITESRALQDRLSDSARTDALTHLPNRAVVMERLERAIAHGCRHAAYGFAVLFMDFDRFKQVNDTLGHGAGDELLRQIARRLSRTLRPGDAVARLQAQVAARLGGDEFVVVLEGVNDVATASAIAQRLLEEVSEPYTIDDNPVQSSASIGLVLCTDLARAEAEGRVPSAEEVLRNADTAMYEAKRGGRGRWVLFDDSMHERVVRALVMETDLRRALRLDELFVVYQPVVDLATTRMVGVEALVRWRHPLRGLVPPVEFIGVAEESGLINELGAQVLDKACRQFMRWQRTMGSLAPLQLAVNLSRAQLRRAALVDDVRNLLAAHAMQPAQLQLEVTESLAAQDEGVQATLRALKDLGVRLALDDFGTGYSSLACLHQMPVDTVKVDRSFVTHAESVEYHRVLIEATTSVARALGMTTVAEGIETEGQAALMRALDCDRGQGYLFSHPLDAAALEAWAREQAPSPSLV